MKYLHSRPTLRKLMRGPYVHNTKEMVIDGMGGNFFNNN